jgi:CRISPR-associated protein Csd1
MILQALYEYYQRKADDPDIAPEGFQWQELKFVIVIDAVGRFQDLNDLREESGKGRRFLLPKAKPRSGKDAWQSTFLLWDHYGYVLAHAKKEDAKSKQMAERQHQVFVDEIKNLPSHIKADNGVNAVLHFYEQKQIDKVKAHVNWPDCAKIAGCNLTFRLDGDMQLVPERDSVVQYQQSLLRRTDDKDDGDEKTIVGRCLITGERGLIKRTHTPTPILGSRSNARLVAFQKQKGYDSYGKEQAYNAPISTHAESAYTTALKHLFASQTNKQMIADSTIVFWSERRNETENSFDLENQFSWFITDKKDDPDRGVQAVKALYDAIHTGRLSVSNDRFYVLGLAPNVARISVRFFRQGYVRDFGEKIKMHFDDLEITKADWEHEYCTLNELLASTAVQTKDRKKPNVVYYRGKYYDVPPNLAGAVIESILDGTPYPITLLQQCVRRIRADVSRKDKNGKLLNNVTRTRAAILKAHLNRIYQRQAHNTRKEITMALDLQNPEVAYLLGRLFALLERIQEESAKPNKLNSTIRERFYASLSSSPPVVLPLLMRLKNHHLAKLGAERAYLKRWFETEIGNVINLLERTAIPPHLTLEQQAQFAIGYYHQRMYREAKKQ